MIFSEYAKTMAGRWMDRGYRAPAEASLDPVEIVGRPEPQPCSTPRAAITLMVGEQVYAGGHWYTIAKTLVERPASAPARVMLHMSDGSIVESRFDLMHTSRDAEEQALADGGAQ